VVCAWLAVAVVLVDFEDGVIQGVLAMDEGGSGHDITR
jgi:hypothetical protein